MGKSKDLASGNSAAYVETTGDTMTGDLTISSTAGQLKLTDTDGTEQNTTIKQSGGNVFIQARDNTNNAGIVFAGNGGGTYDEHLRILPAGGITFNGDTSTDNALGDYEKGSFNAHFQSGYSGSITTYTSDATGYYVKIGHLVHFQIHLFNLTFSGGSSSQSMVLDGLPFVSTYYTSVSHWLFSGFSNIGSGFQPIIRTQTGQPVLIFQKHKDGSSSSLTYGNLGGSLNAMIGGTYYTIE